MKLGRFGTLVLLAVTGVCGFFAWFKQRDQDELEEDANLRRRHLDSPNIDEDWLSRQRLAERP